MAVPHPGLWEKSAASIGSNGSTSWGILGNRGDEVAQALGTEMPGGVYRIGLPRTDLKVVLNGVELKTALALGSWLAFQSQGGSGAGHGRSRPHRR